MKTTIYLIPTGDALIKRYKPLLEPTEFKGKLIKVIKIAPSMLQCCKVDYTHDIVKVLQHYPLSIAAFLESLEYQFLEREHNENILVPERKWKSTPIYFRWLAKMGQLPCTVFFMNDYAARLCCIIGDMLIANKAVIKDDSHLPQLSPEQSEILTERLRTACRQFYLYCRGTGVNPQAAIELLIVEFKRNIYFREIEEKAEEDVRKGLESIEVTWAR